MFADIEFAHAQNAEQHLWKNVFYLIINELRSRVKRVRLGSGSPGWRRFLFFLFCVRVQLVVRIHFALYCQ